MSAESDEVVVYCCEFCHKSIAYPCDFVRHFKAFNCHGSDTAFQMHAIYLYQYVFDVFGQSASERLRNVLKRLEPEECIYLVEESLNIIRNTPVIFRDPPTPILAQITTDDRLGAVSSGRVLRGSKIFQCQACQLVFGPQDDSKEHVLYHCGLKTHFCGLCRRAFYSLVELQEHKKGNRKLHCVPRTVPAFSSGSKLQTSGTEFCPELILELLLPTLALTNNRMEMHARTIIARFSA